MIVGRFAPVEAGGFVGQVPNLAVVFAHLFVPSMSDDALRMSERWRCPADEQGQGERDGQTGGEKFVAADHRLLLLFGLDEVVQQSLNGSPTCIDEAMANLLLVIEQTDQIFRTRFDRAVLC